MSSYRQFVVTTFFILGLVSSQPRPLFAETVLYTFRSDSSTGSLGSAVAGAGDVNNDGYDDIIAGDPDDTTHVGLARVYSGEDGSTLYTFRGDAGNDEFGFAVDGGKDINGDGYDDFVIGGYNNDQGGNDAGTARVYSGKDGTRLFNKIGSGDDQYLGYDVAMIGDVDGDNKDEFAASIIGETVDEVPQVGRVKIFSGVQEAVIHSFAGIGVENFGGMIANAGDVNFDGVEDLIVGAVNGGGSFRGRAVVYSGSDGSVIHEFQGEEAGDRFGNGVGGAGDVNNDGYADLIIGAYLEDIDGVDSVGCATVFSGKDASQLYKYCGDANQDFFGFSVSGAGDLNHDGYDDFLIGISGDDTAGNLAGRVEVYSGVDGSLLVAINGQGGGDRFGSSVSAAGDVNGDGLADFVVGAPEELLEGTRGVVRVYSLLEYDECPNDDDKIEAGACGCGISETDTDSDGTPDCNDSCDDDAAKTDPGRCGCGVEDPASEGDACTGGGDDDSLATVNKKIKKAKAKLKKLRKRGAGKAAIKKLKKKLRKLKKQKKNLSESE